MRSGESARGSIRRACMSGGWSPGLTSLNSLPGGCMSSFRHANASAGKPGYGAFTVSGSRSDDVRNYIASQEAHHRRISFQEEFLTLLKKHGLEYDARDVWG